MKFTIEDLQSAFSLNNTEAVALYAVIGGSLSARLFDDVQRWIRQCYNDPTVTEQRLCAANQIVGGFGVEAIPGTAIRYINMGDTYDVTLVYNPGDHEWSLTSWGDIVEEMETSAE